jgi:hypothetical protein
VILLATSLISTTILLRKHINFHTHKRKGVMMSQATAQQQSQTEVCMQELECYSVEAAEAARSFIRQADVENYKNFLKMMYYYTLDSENKLQFAADHSDNDELREYFLQMKKEETNHFLLAKKDYEGYGGTIDERYIPPVVQAFNDFWYSHGKTDVAEFVGALYIFESIATRVQDDIRDLLQRLEVTGKQSRWLRVHVEADEEHGEEAYDMCAKYIGRNPEAIVAAAAQARDRWIAVFREALS